MTSASHAEGRQFDPGQVYLTIGFSCYKVQHVCQRHSPGWWCTTRRQIDATARGFEPLRAEPNGFRVHHLSHSVTLSCSLHACTTWPVCHSSESCESCRTSVHDVMLNTPCALVDSSVAWPIRNPQGALAICNHIFGASLGPMLLKHTGGRHGHTIQSASPAWPHIRAVMVNT